MKKASLGIPVSMGGMTIIELLLLIAGIILLFLFFSGFFNNAIEWIRTGFTNIWGGLGG